MVTQVHVLLQIVLLEITYGILPLIMVVVIRSVKLLPNHLLLLSVS